MQQSCAISGQTADAAALLRFVTAPDGRLTLDAAHKLPGERFYVMPHAAHVKALAARAGMADAAGFAAEVEQLLRRRVMQGLGLARKAGVLVLGFTKVEAALVSGELALLLAARDGAVHGRKALARKAAALNVPLCEAFAADELGMAIGRANVIHAGLSDAGWAARIGDQIALIAAYGSRADRSEDE